MKKIMFNETYGLETAVLELRKNKTRRFVPQKVLDLVPAYQEEYYNASLETISVADAIYALTQYERRAKAPFYVGEEVAIAQSMKTLYDNKKIFFESQKALLQAKTEACWNNKMFISASVLPHRIKFTDFTVERLQDISSEDCISEGIIEDLKDVQYSFPTNIGFCGQYPFDTPQAAFASLIDKVSGKGTWDANPYVYVYTFELKQQYYEK